LRSCSRLWTSLSSRAEREGPLAESLHEPGDFALQLGGPGLEGGEFLGLGADGGVKLGVDFVHGHANEVGVLGEESHPFEDLPLDLLGVELLEGTGPLVEVEGAGATVVGGAVNGAVPEPLLRVVGRHHAAAMTALEDALEQEVPGNLGRGVAPVPLEHLGLVEQVRGDERRVLPVKDLAVEADFPGVEGIAEDVVEDALEPRLALAVMPALGGEARPGAARGRDAG